MASSKLIPILVEEDETNKRNWVLIELQGELRSTDGHDVDRKGKCLGKLIGRDGDNPVLIIGTSKLEGKRMKLIKPFAILKRCKEGYESQGIVTEKFVFKTRPKPLTVGLYNN